jgi:hypothetical protein
MLGGRNDVTTDATELAPLQLKVFKAIDILVTPDLVAGDSKSITAKTSLIEQSLSRSRERVRMCALKG